MIVKVIRARTPRRDVFYRTLRYVLNPRKFEQAWSSENIVSPRTAATEMTCVAWQSTRCTRPMQHLVLAWHPDDHPSPEQMQETVAMAAHHMGFDEGYQWVAAHHRDAMHDHIHLVANRVHPRTIRAWPREHEIAKARRLAAALDEAYGWRGPRRDAISYAIGSARWERSEISAPSVSPKLYPKGDGNISFHEWLATTVRPALVRALSAPDASWDTMHRTLAEYGVVYQATSRGAVVFDAEQSDTFHAGAFRIARAFGRKRLEARLGPYREPSKDIGIAIGRSYRRTIALGQPRQGPAELRDAFERDLERIRAQRSEARKEMWRAQRLSEKERLAGLKATEHAARLDAKRVFPRDRIRANLARAAARMRFKIQREDLRVAVKGERKELVQNLAGIPAVPTWKSWLVEQAKAGHHRAGAYLEELRNRRSIAVTLPEAIVMPGAPRREIYGPSLGF